jgi:hypothetical protein
VFAGAPQNVVLEFDEKAAGGARKVVFVRFAGGKKADGSGDAGVTAVTVAGPVETGQGASEEGQRLGVAGHADPGGVCNFLDFEARRLEFAKDATDGEGGW